MFDHILVTLDGSPYGERALTYAQAVTRSDARVTLLTVIPPTESPLEPEDPTSSERRAGLCREYLEQHAQALHDTGIGDVTVEVRSGSPARTITEVARELAVDLIVMSTQGFGADTDYGLGSVAARVLASAPCPVLMVRVSRPAPPQNADEERWQAEGGANVG